MENKYILADYNHPLVKKTASELTENEIEVVGKIKKIFSFVKDEIKFGFTKEGDLTKASDTIKYGVGQCNTKTTLFLALCKAIDVPSRVHFSLIKKEIQKGIWTGIFFKLLPKELSHGWIEVLVDGKWRKIDSYINDEILYRAGKEKLKEYGWKTGFSISCEKGVSSASFNIKEEQFVQMDAVILDHGVYNEPYDYYSSKKYRNRPNKIEKLLYRLIIIKVNKNIRNLRSNYCAMNNS